MNNKIPKWYNSFSVYTSFCSELLDISNKITSMTFEERYQDPFKIVKPVIDISTLISRIVPFKTNESNNTVTITNDENIDYLTNYLSYVGVDLRATISTYNDLLFKLGGLRNKYEHVPHLVNSKYAGGSNNASDVMFEIPNRNNGTVYRVMIATDDVEELIVDISNIIFKVVKHIVDDIEQNHIEYIVYPYYTHLKKIKNKISDYILAHQ